MESPTLHSRFTQPDKFTFGTFQTPDGHTCRYGVMPHDQPIGNIVILHGFSEFIEKFYETIRDFHNAGYQVYTFDWRGQGKSERYFKDKLEQVYHTGFDRDTEQLHTFMQSVVTGPGPLCTGPFHGGAYPVAGIVSGSANVPCGIIVRADVAVSPADAAVSGLGSP